MKLVLTGRDEGICEGGPLNQPGSEGVGLVFIAYNIRFLLFKAWA